MRFEAVNVVYAFQKFNAGEMVAGDDLDTRDPLENDPPGHLVSMLSF